MRVVYPVWFIVLVVVPSVMTTVEPLYVAVPIALLKVMVCPMFPTDPAVRTSAKVEVGGNGGKLLSKYSKYVSR